MEPCNKQPIALLQRHQEVNDDNMPMLYTANLNGCKNDNIQSKNFDSFLNFLFVYVFVLIVV